MKLVWIHHQTVMIYLTDLSAILCINILHKMKEIWSSRSTRPYLSLLQSALKHILH